MVKNLSLAFCVLSLAACGGSSGTDAGTDAGGTDSGGSDSGGSDSGGSDAGGTDGGGTDAGGLDLGLPDLGGMDAGCGPGAGRLVVKNADLWCTISVAGMAGSGLDEQSVCLPSGPATLTAMPNSGFILGNWHHTTGDTGSGDPGMVTGTTSTAMATVIPGATTCVWTCCPFPGGTGCPTTDQCP